MNALTDVPLIEALVLAGRAGAEIDLIVRGACMLPPGLEGVTERIRVRSVVGRFLEHSRIFYFQNDGDERVYLSSADWMDRNFFRRIETGFPILNPKLKKRVIAEGLKPYLRDNVQAWEMQSDGSFRRRSPRRAQPYSAQAELLALLSKQKQP